MTIDFQYIAYALIAYKLELEAIATDILNQNADAVGKENKPNYSNRDFMNAVIIFQPLRPLVVGFSITL